MQTSSQKTQQSAASAPERAVNVPADGAQGLPEGSFDKVRDILFGAQIREHEVKRMELEQQFKQQTEALQQEISERFSVLAQEVKKAQRELRDALKSEELARERDVARLEKGIEKIAQTLMSHDAHHHEVQAHLRDQILSETQQVRVELSARQDEAKAKINALMVALDESKVGRQPLALFLSELAGRLEANANPKG